MLPWAVGLASLVVQTHLSFVYVVGDRRCGRRRRRRARRPAATPRRRSTPAGVAPAVLAAGVVAVRGVGAAASSTSSPAKATSARCCAAAAAGTADRIGLRLGVRLVASVVALPPWWSRPGFSDTIGRRASSTTGDGPDVAEGNVAVARRRRRSGCSSSPSCSARSIVVGWRRRRSVAVAVGAAGRRRRRRLRSSSMVLSPVNVIGLSPHQMRWLWPVVGAGDCWPAASPSADWAPARRAVTTASARSATVVLAVLDPADVRRTRGADRRPATTGRRSPRSSISSTDYRPGRPGRVRHQRRCASPSPTAGRCWPRSGATTSTFAVTDEGMVRQVGERRRADGQRDAPASCSSRATRADVAAAGARTDRLRRRHRRRRAGRARRAAGRRSSPRRPRTGLQLNEAGRDAVAAGRIDFPPTCSPPGDDATALEAPAGSPALDRATGTSTSIRPTARALRALRRARRAGDPLHRRAVRGARSSPAPRSSAQAPTRRPGRGRPRRPRAATGPQLAPADGRATRTAGPRGTLSAESAAGRRAPPQPAEQLDVERPSGCERPVAARPAAPGRRGTPWPRTGCRRRRDAARGCWRWRRGGRGSGGPSNARMW